MNILDFIKATTLEEKLKLIKFWATDRGADGEGIFDLDDRDDAIEWIDLYGVENLYNARHYGRYWIGGWQYSYNGYCSAGATNFNCKSFTIEKVNEYIRDIVSYDIESRYETYLKDNIKEGDSIEGTIKWISDLYGGLIDFEGYAKAKGDLKSYTLYAWICRSNDGSYEDCDFAFTSQDLCYDSMREAALKKMKWNTRYEDVTDGLNMDYSNDTFIDYSVKFNANWIEHNSYSGKYIYLIVRCDSVGNFEPGSWKKLDEMLKEKK